MAQYYNLVTTPNGTITIEDVHHICSTDGQSVQFLVEDVNNGGNGSQQFLAYTAEAQSSNQAIFPHQTINLGGQIATTQLDQRQNVYIIKTNELASPPNILKTNVNAHIVGENIVNVVENQAPKQNTFPPAKSQTATPIRPQPLNNIAPSPVVQQQQTPRQHSTPQSFPSMEKKPVRLYQNKRQSLTKTAGGVPNSQMAGNILSSQTNSTPNSNAANSRNSTPTFRPKTYTSAAAGPGLSQTPAARQQLRTRLDTPHSRKPLHSQMPKNSSSLRCSEMEHLSERIKQERLKQIQGQRQPCSPAANHEQSSPVQRQQQGSVTPQQQIQQLMNSPVQRQQVMVNAGQQTQQMTLIPQQQHQQQQFAQMQRQPMIGPQQRHRQASDTSEQPVQNSMEADCPENQQEVSTLNQQNCTPQADADCNTSQSYAYFQKIIENPQTTTVQQQIQGNTAKMLVVLLNGEQRLITFDVPNEDCTVNDLLEQVNLSFNGETVVTLVTDPALGINYIVEVGSGSSLQDGSEQGEIGGPLDNTATTPNSPTLSFNASDENSNSSLTQNEEPKFIEGMLAVCPNCGITSNDFNRCLRCKTKLPEDVKAIPVTTSMQAKKESMLSIDVNSFYKKPGDKLEKSDGIACKRGRARGHATRRKPVKEPECLTISSDEDEDEEGKSKKTDDRTADGEEGTRECPGSGGGKEGEPQINSNSATQISQTSLLCRTVRIGSYKYVPREKVAISQHGVRLSVPLLEDDKNFVTLEVQFKDIIKVLIHFGKSMPVLFFYTTTSTGAMIRELLGMQDPKGPYYDPAGKDHTHKRITLLPERVSEESKVILKTLFAPRRMLEELSPKEANDILVRASPKDSLQVQNISKKQSLASSTNNISVNSGIQTITVYPPPPAKGGIAINTEDYACLAEDQFLNDVIIDFYLKYLTLEMLSEADQSRTHVFSSYFYKRLTSPHTQAAESAVPLSAPAKRHARVQKWTKNVNIFEKDFIVIPINEHAHWFLAIICFPGLVGKVMSNSPLTKEQDTQKATQKSKKLKEMKLQAVTIGSTTITPVKTTITIDQGDDGSERDEAEGDDEEMEVDSEDEEDEGTREDGTNQQVKSQPSPQCKPEQQDVVKIPCILIFDSLAGASRSRVVATLRDYLSCEYLAKMGKEKVFSKDTIKGASPKVPQQSNFTDCGVYVLQYVESFFKDPIKDYTLPIKTLRNWFEEIVVTRKREELSKLLVKLMNASKGDKNISLPTLTFPTQDGKLIPKPENHPESKSVKSETDKKKSAPDGESRSNTNATVSASPANPANPATPATPATPTIVASGLEASETTSEVLNRTTYQIIPYSPSSSNSSTEGSQTEMFTETKTRTSSETMTYLKAKRIARLTLKTPEIQDDTPTAKKHKGDSIDSCK
ncbi:uncharacterized protein LOC105703068 isoform X2 [Orussus abietinus]|uniref:uncharacterized protein LOC105703068 isoform X2 n=1 Tax=Orussus abietinus TaxID=222816 RepID=UPI0006263E13|nr:uncharacterized protein LOC105703068 isoform X2 [Orussus abietinus]